MATPFSRTTRSLQADNNYSQVGLLVAILLAMMWVHWFLTAEIMSYEVSQALYVTDKEKLRRQFSQDLGAKRVQTIRNRLVVAEFPPKVMASIHPWQRAFVQLEKRTTLIPATVVNVSAGPTKGTVELRAEIDAAVPNPFETGEGGEVKIEVENVTQLPWYYALLAY
ncbi:MAG: hypothetical protein DRR19_12055 [Candidatus Parabeggiatoa sp. nov. 1]|nr:MAG: hypothetical protein DRR19_12055 [Gammaproteobacteria bacterium]